MEGVSRQAPCSCTELLDGRPLQFFPKRSCCLEGSFGILCCLPTKRNCWFRFSPSALCPSGCGVDARRAPCSRRASRSDAWLPWPTESLPVLSDVECCAWTRGLGLDPSKLHALSLDANDCRARLGGPTEAPNGAPRGTVMRAPASGRNVTWLILPVVICLSQRLSHACVSMN